MSRYKCPACGATKIVKIIYGEPTHETYEASLRGEIILGGCEITGFVQLDIAKLVD